MVYIYLPAAYCHLHLDVTKANLLAAGCSAVPAVFLVEFHFCSFVTLLCATARLISSENASSKLTPNFVERHLSVHHISWPFKIKAVKISKRYSYKSQPNVFKRAPIFSPNGPHKKCVGGRSEISCFHYLAFFFANVNLTSVPYGETKNISYLGKEQS